VIYHNRPNAEIPQSLNGKILLHYFHINPKSPSYFILRWSYISVVK